MIKILATLAGLGLLGATAHVTVAASGGYASEHAPVVIAVAIGVAVGSVCIGKALSERRYVLAITMLACTLAGEAYSLVSTAERIVSGREALQAPVTAIGAEREAGLKRLAIVEAAKKAADDALLAKASDKGCVKNCRALLEGAVAAAKVDVDDARRSIAVMPVSRSATPLADRIGLPGWALDLIQAALVSIGANGLGACLLAFGTHIGAPTTRQQRQGPAIEAMPAPTLLIETSAPAQESRTPAKHAAEFDVEKMAPGGHHHVGHFLLPFRTGSNRPASR